MTEAAKKSSVFGFLKTLVAEEVPDKAPSASSAPNTHGGDAGAHAEPAHAFSHASVASGSGAAEPDPQALAKLESRLQAACPEPYRAFMEQFEALREDIPDERTRFKVALKTTHTTQEQIGAGIELLLEAMHSAKNEFVHSFEENRQKRIGEAAQSIKSTDELIKSSEEQIQSIQEKIASLKTKRATDSENMQHEAGRLDAIRGGFEAAHAQIVARLEDQKRRVSTTGAPPAAKA